jgi:hypothetical protein
MGDHLKTLASSFYVRFISNGLAGMLQAKSRL